ncbi:MAG: right-handed parallel beta-helix repeat-containing protein [Terracidiphilus sp.]
MSVGARAAAPACTHFVSGTGNDAASGMSKHDAFRTLQRAADLTKPGDSVCVMNGIYSNSEPRGEVLTISIPGTVAKWIRYVAYPGQIPEISFNGWDGVKFGPTAAYIELRGFRITGNSDHVTLEESRSRGSTPEPSYDGNCVLVDGVHGGKPGTTPHHLRIVNNVIGKCGGGGIATMWADYVTISGNTVYDSAWYSIYGNSGISTYQNWNTDNYTGYKMFIVGNRVYGNSELLPWAFATPKPYITDGEGIIIDDQRHTQGKGPHDPYIGRTLIANNVVYDNGSDGIEVYSSDHVDVVNNSTYHNVRTPEETGRGEIYLNSATDVNVLNNIFVSASGQNPVHVEEHAANSAYFNFNLYYNGVNKLAAGNGPDDLYSDPGFIDPDAPNRALADFRVGPRSPAVDSGTDELEQRTDFDGTPRLQGRGYDRGAFDR